MAISPVITTAGLGAVLNATNDGLSAQISHIALGDAAWSADNSATALQNERNRIAISGGERIQPNQLHISAIENGDVEYWIREIGFILEDGTLFAIWSDEDQALAFKASNVDVLLAFDLVLSALPDNSVNIVGTGGVNLPPATQTILGVMRFASNDEALAGEAERVAMSPVGTQQHGDQRYARVVHRHRWTNIDDRPATYPPVDHGHAWGEITDKPATYPATSHVHTWASVTGKPASFTPASHSHAWSSITGKPSSFTPSSHTHLWSSINDKPETYPPSGHTHTLAELSDAQFSRSYTYVLNRDIEDNTFLTMQPITRIVKDRTYTVEGTLYMRGDQVFGASPSIDIDTSAASQDDIRGHVVMYGKQVKSITPRVLTLVGRTAFFPRFDLDLQNFPDDDVAVVNLSVSFLASLDKSFRVSFNATSQDDTRSIFLKGSTLTLTEHRQ